MPHEPLTEEHREILTRLLSKCAETGAVLERCRACHLDVDAEMRQNKEQQEIATAILKQFFPHKA